MFRLKGRTPAVGKGEAKGTQGILMIVPSVRASQRDAVHNVHKHLHNRQASSRTPIAGRTVRHGGKLTSQMKRERKIPDL